MIVGGARRSLNGDQECGDAYAWWRTQAQWTICLVDGLGHGPKAAQAAQAALVLAEAQRAEPPDEMIGAIDRGIRWTRGAAIAVAQVDPASRTLRYCGVGNVRAALFGDPAIRFEGTPGIVGAGVRPLTTDIESWRDGDLLVLWTDGFSARLDLDDGCLRLRGDPEALATRLIDHFSTRRDDAGVVCCLLEGDAR